MFFEYITLASIINFLLLASILLFKKSPDRKSNNILFVLFMFMAIYCSLVNFHYTSLEYKEFANLQYYTPIDGTFLLLLGPCLYFYILAVLNKPTPVFNRKNLIHCIAFIPYISFCIYFVLLPFQQRIDWLINDFHTGTSEMVWLNGIIYLQIITYLLVCYRLISKQQNSPNIIEHDKKQFDISWIKVYLIINLCFMIATLPFCFIISNERTNIMIGQLAMDIQFIYMFYKWTLHTDSSTIIHSDESAKSNTLKFDSDVANSQLSKLQIYMEESRPYLDEACSIQTVSQQTGIPFNQLSNILNCKLQKTFPEYVNEYRINAAKAVLLSIKSDTVTIESIALDCGFGSKSNFNRTFKKYTNNLTPREFLRQNKSSE